MRKLLLALEVYQMASLRLHELRLKGDDDSYAEQHRDDSMDDFGIEMDEYIDKRVNEAIEKHEVGHELPESGY